jgi:hypothetical protein
MNFDNNKPIQRVGRFFTKGQIERFRNFFINKKLSVEQTKTEEVREGEYFSRHLFESLLSVPNCAGLSIMYGAAPEKGEKITEDGDEIKIKPRLFIVPVDENGKAIPFYLKADSTGLKDVEEQFEGGGEGKPIPPYGQ